MILLIKILIIIKKNKNKIIIITRRPALQYYILLLLLSLLWPSNMVTGRDSHIIFVFINTNQVYIKMGYTRLTNKCECATISIYKQLAAGIPDIVIH